MTSPKLLQTIKKIEVNQKDVSELIRKVAMTKKKREGVIKFFSDTAKRFCTHVVNESPPFKNGTGLSRYKRKVVKMEGKKRKYGIYYKTYKNPRGGYKVFNKKSEAMASPAMWINTRGALVAPFMACAQKLGKPNAYPTQMMNHAKRAIELGKQGGSVGVLNVSSKIEMTLTSVTARNFVARVGVNKALNRVKLGLKKQLERIAGGKNA